MSLQSLFSLIFAFLLSIVAFNFVWADSPHSLSRNSTVKDLKEQSTEEQSEEQEPEAPLTFEDKMEALVETDLIDAYYGEEGSKISNDAIEKSNQEFFAEMRKFIPESYVASGIDNYKTRKMYSQITYEAANSLLQNVKHAPHVSDYYLDFYNAQAVKKEGEGTDIGFCFGRAFFIRSVLLKMNMQPNAIRKVFIVGPLGVWDYHMATAVYTDRGWMVLDPHYIGGGPATIEDWFNTYNLLTIFKARKSQLFVTDGLKFQARMGAPTFEYLAQLEDYDAEAEDYYRGYFQGTADLLDRPSHSARTLQRLGVTPLTGDISKPGQLDHKLLKKDLKRYEIINGRPNYYDELNEFPLLQKYIDEKSQYRRDRYSP